MGKRREKRLGRQPSSSNDTTIATIENNPGPEKKGGVSLDQELERQIAYVKAMSDMEAQQLLTSVDLVRSQFTEEQQQTSAPQFCKENLPSVSIVRNSDEHFELQWKEENGNLATHK